MPKTGLKTFVYSFSISLLMIFSLDRVFGRALPSTPQAIEIPSKNIMLFIRREQADPSSRPVPVKKIALRVLPEIPEAVAKIPAAEDSGEEIIMADMTADISEEASPFLEELTVDPAESYVLAAQDEPVLITETKQIVYEPEQKPLPLQKDATEPKPRAVENITIPLERPGASTFAKTAPAPGKVPPLKVEKEAFPAEKSLKTPEFQPKMMVAVREENPHRLLPLQKSRDELAGLGKNIRIADAREANQVALADSNVPIKSMTEENATKADEQELAPKEKWQKMADKPRTSDSPWVVAKGAVKPQNSMVAQEVYYQKDNQQIKNALSDAPQDNGDSFQLASETVKNLLIPIPEEILNDENLTPQLVSPSHAEDLQKEAELEAEMRRKKELEAAIKQKKMANEASKAPQEKLLSSLTSIFNSRKEDKGTKAAEEGLVETIKKKIKQSPSHGKIIPTEMRLSFQPNRAEISGQTLRWIQAFAAKTATEADMAIEIRIDGTGAMDLQQKRLNLLHNILTNKGVEYSKINTVFTTREPNSFIIRTVKLNFTDNFKTGSTNGNMRKASDGYYLQW